MDKRRIEYLLEQCTSENSHHKIEAILELSDNRVYEAFQTIIQLADSEDAIVRSTVAEALGCLGVQETGTAGPVLMRLLNDPDYLVRDDAVGSLGLLAYLPARESIETILQDDSEWIVRASAAEALGYLGDQRSLTALKAGLIQDEVETVRGWAAHSLGLLGNAEVLPLLESRLAVEAADNTRADLLAALYRLGSRDALGPLLDLLASEDNAVVYAIINRLENLLKLRNPPTLVEDANHIRHMLMAVAERLPASQDQIDDMMNKLLELESKAYGKPRH